MRDLTCPICRGDVLERYDERLDQSGDSFLPTTCWRCPRCAFARFEPAFHRRWIGGGCAPEAAEPPRPQPRRVPAADEVLAA